MKVELFPFQKQALAGLRMQSAEALGSYRRTHSPQVVSFTAPTGAGKTIIMASLIESIYFGDDIYPDQQNAMLSSVSWIWIRIRINTIRCFYTILTMLLLIGIRNKRSRNH